MTTTTSSSSTSEEGWFTIFAPVTQQSASSLDVPDFPQQTYASPITQVTQLSLEVPKSGVTWDPSLVIPVVTATSKTTFITIAPSAHIEHEGSTLILPDGGETTTSGSPSAKPKFPHLENPGSELDKPPAETTKEPATTDDGSPGVTSTAHTEITGIELITPGESGGGGAPPTQNGDQTSPTSNPDNDDDSQASQASTFLIDNTPITAGGSPITISGTTISLFPSGEFLVLNGAAIPVTRSDGRLLPAPTGESDAGSEDSSTASADDETAQATGTETNPTATTSGSSDGSPQETNDSSNNEDGTTGSATTAGESPAEQTDSAGAAVRALAWEGMVGLGGVIGLLASLV